MPQQTHVSGHAEASSTIGAGPETVFAVLDDQTRLAKHMDRPSMMMGGGRMTYEFDAAKGQSVGSHIRMGGEAFGRKLAVEEVVTEREPPNRKVWRTIGIPQLMVIGPYEMVSSCGRPRMALTYGSGSTTRPRDKGLADGRLGWARSTHGGA